MSGLILPNRFTSQPQVQVGIDRSNPLTAGLAFAWNAANPRHLENGRLATTDNTGKIISSVGRAVDSSTGQVNLEWANYQPIVTSNGAGTGDFTLCLLANPAVAGGGAVEHGLAQKNDAAGAPYAQATLLFHANATAGYVSGSVSFFTYSSASAGIAATGKIDGNWHLWTGTRRGATFSLYRDAELIVSATDVVRNISQASRYLAIGSRGNGTTEAYRDGAAFALGANRALSASEIATLASNPWQIFQPPQRRIWVAGTSSGSTGTVAVTNANDTSSASGTTTVVGTVARTNANDTSSASGTTTILGTVSVTNAADTSSASGTTTITGTSATTNANDTSSASGSVGDNVTGTVATTNANDTSAASGTTTVTGTLARTNANDTSSASGTTTVTGTVASTNANDTAAASGIAGSITGTVATTNNNDTVLASGTAGSLRTNRGGGWETYVAPIRKKTVKEVKKEFENLTYSEIVDEQKTAEIKIQHTQAKIQEIKSNVSAVKPFSLAPEIAKLKLLIAEEKIKIEALRELETKILIHAKIKKEKEKLLTDLAFIAEYLMDEDEYDYD